MTHARPFMSRLALVVAAVLVALAMGIGNAAADDDAGLPSFTPLELELRRAHVEPDAAALAGNASLHAEIMALAEDAGQPNRVRRRAITTIGAMDTPAARESVQRILLANLDDDIAVAHWAILAVGALADTDPAWAIELTEGLVAHDDFGIRVATVETLDALRAFEGTHDRAHDALMQLVIAERNPAVQEALAEVMEPPATNGTSIGSPGNPAVRP